jgi:hypothetical protein
MEYMRDAVAFEHISEALRPGHSAIVSDLHCVSSALSCSAKAEHPVSSAPLYFLKN